LTGHGRAIIRQANVGGEEMFVFQNLLIAVARVLNIALTLYLWIIIARAVLSWIHLDPRNAVVQFIYRVTEPVLRWIRFRIPLSFGGIDISPILVILAIYFIKIFFIESLLELAYRLG
jgi:YggT family protein